MKTVKNVLKTRSSFEGIAISNTGIYFYETVLINKKINGQINETEYSSEIDCYLVKI